MFASLYMTIVSTLFKATLLLAGTGSLFDIYSNYQTQSLQLIKQGG